MHKLHYKGIIHGIQAGIIIACLAWGGLHLGNQTLSALTPSLVSVHENDEELTREYPDLPLGVARAVHSVVATQQILDDQTGQGIVASGVKLSDQQIITAGHNVESAGSLNCARMNVIAPAMVSGTKASDDMVTHASVKYSDRSDLAILTVNNSENFRSLPTIKVSSRQVETGETVYFINFQPTADGRMRSPAAKTADTSHPAVFVGTVVGSSANGIGVATGFGKSLGHGAPDNLVRKGASGGAIVNTDGELVGLSVSSESLQSDLQAQSINIKYGSSLPSGNYQLAYMQPVRNDILDRMQTSMISCST